jgi:hypothetical protein
MGLSPLIAWGLSAISQNESIDIDVSILFSIDIDEIIDDTFQAGIDIEYWRYFSKVSLTTLPRSAHNY